MNNKDKTIFIGIGAYNEIYIKQTIENALSMSKYPDRLRFGIFSLNSDNQIFSFSENKNVKVLNAQYPSLLGVCSSRAGSLFLYNNEDFYLQIDAHMLFGHNWDEVLINSYYYISQKENCKHPLITTRPDWWINGENNEILHYSPEKKLKQPVMSYMKESYLWSDIPLFTSFDPEWKDNKYFEHFGFSAHFAFTSSSFIFDVMPDINFMFYGEEQTTALRAWTRDYRIFSLPENIIWHYNKVLEEKGKLSIKHLYKKDRLNEKISKKNSKEFNEKNKKAIERTRKILTGKILGYWGSPDIKSLEDYQKASGFDFKEFYKKRDEIKNK